MQEVIVKKDELLEILMKNKATHIDEFVESVADYKELVIKIAKKNLELAETGEIESIGKTESLPSKPRSYEKSYTKSIRMLELSVEETIKLSEDEFSELVLDEWNWKRGFDSAKSLYKGM